MSDGAIIGTPDSSDKIGDSLLHYTTELEEIPSDRQSSVSPVDPLSVTSEKATQESQLGVAGCQSAVAVVHSETDDDVNRSPQVCYLAVACTVISLCLLSSIVSSLIVPHLLSCSYVASLRSISVD